MPYVWEMDDYFRTIAAAPTSCPHSVITVCVANVALNSKGTTQLRPTS